MVWIPAGKFSMGDIQGRGHPRERPVHRVSVKRFAMSRYEITFAEFDRFSDVSLINRPDDEKWGRGDRPVINVSFRHAREYADWLSQQTGYQYRLPTEAEWEYAARAGTTTKYWWGNHIGYNRANCQDCGSQWDSKKTASVGSFPANPFGLYDTVGNVYELTCSEFKSSYSGEEQRCLDKNNTEPDVVIRGGSWKHSPWHGRAAYRNEYFKYLFNRDDIGFRIVREK